MRIENKNESTPIFKGDKKSFNKFIGPRLRNFVQSLTKKHKKEIGKCEHCGVDNKKFDAAHKHDFTRKKIIEKILSDYRIDHIKYEVDLIEFEKKFKSEHTPISRVILVLCESCHTLYDKNINDSIRPLDRSIKTPEKTNNKSQHRTTNGMKIGAFVRDSFRKAYKQNLITEDEIKRLLKESSKETFNLRYTILALDDNKYDAKRYYAGEFCGKYKLTNDWYDDNRNHWQHFLNWLKKIGYSYKEKISE